MRLSEKTLELSICGQITLRSGVPAIWFGLTQKQEAAYGFDACSRISGRFLVLQFKASNQVLGSGERLFQASHSQMTKLQGLCRGHQGVFFYVLPHLGTVAELPSPPNLLPVSWTLDVASLPNPMSPPTTAKGTPRKSAEHYLYLDPPIVTVRSDPIELPVTSLSSLFVDSKRLANIGVSTEDRWTKSFLSSLADGDVRLRKAYGVILPS